MKVYINIWVWNMNHAMQVCGYCLCKFTPLDVDPWHTWFMQVYGHYLNKFTPLDLDPWHMLFMQVVTLAYASCRCRTSFTHASSPLCLDLVLIICMLWCFLFIPWVRLFESNIYFMLNVQRGVKGDNIKRFNWHRCLKRHKINL